MTLAAAAAVAAIVGTVATTAVTVQSSLQQASAAKAEAKSREQQAAFQEEQSRRQSQMLIGKQIAMGAASGVDVTSGSPLFMELDSVRQGELEAQNIRHQGALAVSSKKYEASMAMSRIPGTIVGGVASGASTVLGNWVKK